MKHLPSVVAWCATLSTAGCHRYAPATVETVPEGARVRVLLSSEAEGRVRERYGIRRATPEGTLVARNGDTLSLLFASVPASTTFGTETLYQQVDLARADLLRVDVQQVDSFRTAVLVTAGVGAVTAIAVQVFRGGEPGSGNGDGTPPPESVRGWLILVPLLRW